MTASALALRDPVLLKLEAARQFLSDATDLAEVKNIADVAASAEVYARRQQLGEEAIGFAHRVKIDALARLGELLAVMPKAKGGEHGGRSRIDGTRAEPSISAPTLADLGIDKKVSAVAQRLAAMPAAMREEIASRETSLAAAMNHNHRAQGSGENEWYTPPQYIELARRVLGEIDLDPASSVHAQQQVRAAKWFTQDDDGLKHEWRGRVWLNPPYSQPAIGQFVTKLCGELDAGRIRAAVMLTHNYTDTAWFHEAAGACRALCFTRGRIRFVSPDGEEASPTQGQTFFYFGPAPARFAKVFADVGFVR